MTIPHYVAITRLDDTGARAIVDALVANSPLPDRHTPKTSTPWLLATTRDGLVTGHYRRDRGTWARSTDATTDGVGLLTTEALQMVRLFDEHDEILLRATPTGAWRGRVLSDVPVDDVLERLADPARPIDRSLLLVSGRVDPEGEFRRVTGAGNLSHVVPRDWAAPGTRLLVRDYLASDPDSGQLRVACSRCVGFRSKEAS